LISSILQRLENNSLTLKQIFQQSSSRELEKVYKNIIVLHICKTGMLPFPGAVGQWLQIVDVQECAVSKNAAPQNSSLVEEI
jgi:hypothetical protein